VTDKEMFKAFNEFFATVFTGEDTRNVPNVQRMIFGTKKEELSDLIISQKIVADKLVKLRVYKATGADELSPRYLKAGQVEICIPLLKLYQRSLKESSVPDDWKSANVCAIFKKGRKSEASNYRPASLTSQCSKMFESIVRDKRIDHLERWKLIVETQHGFRKGGSCLTNILTFLDQVTRWVDDGKSVDVVYLDFA